VEVTRTLEVVASPVHDFSLSLGEDIDKVLAERAVKVLGGKVLFATNRPMEAIEMESPVGKVFLDEEFWPVAKYNPCHEPSTGRFCSTSGSTALEPFEGRVDYHSVMERGEQIAKQVEPKVKDKLKKIEEEKKQWKEREPAAMAEMRSEMDRHEKYSDAWYKASEKVYKERQEHLTRVETLRKEIHQEIQAEFAGVPGHLKVGLSGLNDKARGNVQPAIDWTQRFVGKGSPVTARVEVYDPRKTSRKDWRAEYVLGENRIRLGTPQTRATSFVHEYGHHLEVTVPGLNKAALGLQSKHKGKWVSDYAKTQVRWKGGTATEVLSVGLENLYRDPAKLMRRDPQLFRFTLGALSVVASKTQQGGGG